MSANHDTFQVIRPLTIDGEEKGIYYSLPELEKAGVGKISRLPVSIRVVLESVLRNCDGKRIQTADVERLAQWDATNPSKTEIPFVVSRIVLQDFTGVPLLVDLAAMRAAVAEVNKDPSMIEPLVPVDLVIDHSVQVDRSRTPGAFLANMKTEFQRNLERYEFLKWGQQAFDTFKVVPPAIGIVHQVNLEYLACVAFSRENEEGQTVFYPDSLVGTDSHTTMINGLGVVGWGVGGIEAESGMLGQPVYFQTPEVIGVHLSNDLPEGTTATDLALRVTQLLRKENVVGKFVEFFGEGARRLTVADRSTIANMAPEYGATMGFFPVDEESLKYLQNTGRDEADVAAVKAYYEAQGMFGIPTAGDVDYSKVVELDLATVEPSVAGPKRPQDRMNLSELKGNFEDLFTTSPSDGGFGLSPEERQREVLITLGEGEIAGITSTGNSDLKPDGTAGDSMSEKEMITNRPSGNSTTLDDIDYPEDGKVKLRHGSVLIAAITSCTNTSNPSVMLAAGLVAKKALEKGLNVPPQVKTSLAPGSRVVTEYLNETGLQESLDALGFNLVGYGCTTCIGNSGPLAFSVEEGIREGNLVGASVLSGNRNFEARIHGAIKANYLMSPPLVVAFALAGRVDIDLNEEPIAVGKDGVPVYLRDIWPTREEIQEEILRGVKPEMFKSRYADIMEANKEWTEIENTTGQLFEWKEESTYIQKPPYFDGFSMEPESIEEISGMRPLAILGDSVTTDHISPAGAFSEETPAGQYLLAKGVEKKDFNSYGSRRGNDRIMTRGTFANVRVKNHLADGKEGGFTKIMPEGKPASIYEACQVYAERKTPLIVFAGEDYGMGSSRDWAAKGTKLLGVKAVVAASFERIHRSNLLGMGVLPLQFPEGVTTKTLGLDGTEQFSVLGLNDTLMPGQDLTLVIERKDGEREELKVRARVDTAIEVEYYRHGGILPYVLRSILREND
ncbi:MAG: aconitate hydratase [Opitutales bacterium]|nr:aconitate hydratase [Opitutales bacterium]